ncbi:MAG: hypothetical protein ACFFKA_03115, partial [Candidatus Thorarchaeota archaeon]
PSIILVLISITPFLSGVLDPSTLASNFGITFPGIGPFLMIISAICLFFVGRWERRKRTALGLVEKKFLKWNKLRKIIRYKKKLVMF